MIVKRFKSMGWVGCVGIAALGCYMISQRVASERTAVEKLDRQIVMLDGVSDPKFTEVNR